MENNNDVKSPEVPQPTYRTNPLGNVVIHSLREPVNKKLLFFVIVGILIGVFFIYWPGRMVKYTDSGSRFSFYHPANWKELSDEDYEKAKEVFGDIVGEMSGMNILVMMGRDVDRKESKNVTLFMITKTDIPSDSPVTSAQDEEFKEGMNKVLEFFAKQYPGLNEIENNDIEIDGIPAWKKIITFSEEEHKARVVWIYLIKEKKMYYFAFVTDIEASLKLINTEDKVIESFKFKE